MPGRGEEVPAGAEPAPLDVGTPELPSGCSRGTELAAVFILPIMRYHALVCDYDGTVARDGILEDPTRRALERLRAAGRKVILATGRRIEDLKVACPDLSVFDVVVGENGAILYWPPTNELRLLAEAPPPACPLTGEPAPHGAVPDRPALAIKVENAPEARPQSGMDKADVVYEEVVEGGVVRFMAVFQSQDAAEVGPVRSVRPVDPDIVSPEQGPRQCIPRRFPPHRVEHRAPVERAEPRQFRHLLDRHRVPQPPSI